MKKFVLAVMAVILTACTTTGIPSYRSLAAQVVPTNVELRATLKNYLNDTTEDVTYCSGVIVSPTHILTAGHCTEAAKNIPAEKGQAVWDGKVKIRLIDGTEVYAKIIVSAFKEGDTTESARDVALLMTDQPVLKNIAKIGNSNSVHVGDTIFIVGNSYGDLVYTFSMGVVSYINRELKSYGVFLQTDTFAAPGNSGGPVFDAEGKLIGLLVRGGGGVSFVLPINEQLAHLWIAE